MSFIVLLSLKLSPKKHRLMWILGLPIIPEDTKMKTIKALFIIAALTVSSFAMAEGGGDRTFARMEVARNNSMESYQIAQQQSTQPPIAESKVKAMGHKNC